MRGTAVAPDAYATASDQPIQEPAEDRSSQRQSFVGRESELRQLQTAFESAAAGNAALILLVGEPGIGKTALCDQLCRFASASGGLPLVGHCYEEGSFRPPYQPFVEVLGTYLHGLDTEALQAELGPSAADLARIIPILRERLDVSPLPRGDPEEDRWRLLQAVTELLHRAAAKQPLVVVLEDLHDADRGTLDLLLYLARNLHDSRILVVGTYRDVEVDRAHPLTAALSELHRASNVARVQLHGLSAEEVQRLLAETSQQTVPQPFADVVQRRTEGNPLFVRETLRFVIDTGLVERRDGALWRVGDQSLAGRIPEGLRDAVGKRLSRLSESTNRVLSVASIIGREFHLDVLSRVLAGAAEELEAALEEASASGIIEEHSSVGASITYRFGHAFFRETLYDEIVAPRRIRLHQQVAHALEEVYSRRLDEHAAELAEHYSFYSDTLNLAKAVQYGEVAARHATEVFAYGEAARQLERALVVQDLVDPDDQAKCCDLLLALGGALLPTGETERVITHVAPDAYSLAEKLGDRGRAFRACRLAMDCLVAAGAGVALTQPEYLMWAERASQYADPKTIERSVADSALARALYSRSQFAQARALRLQALALARQHADYEALFGCANNLIYSGAPQHWDERVQLVEECAGWSHQSVSGQTLGLALWFGGMVQLARGERVRAEGLWRQLEELAVRTRVATANHLVAARDVTLAIVDGRLDEALKLSSGLVELGDESGVPVRGRQFRLNMLIAPALYLGRADVWLTALDEDANLVPTVLHAPASVARTATRVICLGQLGRMSEALAVFEPLVSSMEKGIDEHAPMLVLATLLQAAIVLGERRTAHALAARLACVAHLAPGDSFYCTCVARHLGDASVLVGDRTAARAYYRQAVQTAGKIGFRPELALAHLRLAELLLEEADDAARSEAVERLDLAIPELRDMKMRPGLERALALREKITPTVARALARESAPDGLTVREREIASLMADGLSNHDIARRLVIAEGTVEVHVKHILGKLGFRSRAQVAGWFARQGPV
jgi:DNA-binding CsgD family transcriptional regulator